MTETAQYHLVELHRPETGWRELQALSSRARSPAQRVNSQATPVRFLRSIFIPDDETCFHLFAGSAEGARAAAAIAQLSVERVTGCERAESPTSTKEDQ